MPGNHYRSPDTVREMYLLKVEPGMLIANINQAKITKILFDCRKLVAVACPSDLNSDIILKFIYINLFAIPLNLLIIGNNPAKI